MSTRKTLRSLVEARRGVLVPGAFNALSARVIADLGFEAIYVTGAGVTNMWFGMPDQGFMGLHEIADHTARIRDAVDLPLIVDADTGFGNALNVRHTVRVLERSGADCIQFEDQVAPKRCGHFSGKDVVSTEEAVSKIKAAVDARHDPDFLVMARTDAAATHGFEAAVERAHRFAEAGADCIQLEDQVAPKRCGHFSGKDVISTEEAVAKIKAAVDARQDAQLMIMARTDACATQGFEAAVERAQRFAEAGADILFVEAVTKAEEVRALPQRLAKPQLMNMVIGGRTPIFNAQQLGELGYGIVLYANAALQGAVAGMQKALTVLRDEKEVQESSGLVTPFAERQRLVGKPDWDALEKRYAAE